MTEGIEIGEPTIHGEPIADEPTTMTEEVVEVAEDDQRVDELSTGQLTPEQEKELIDRLYPLPEDFPSQEQLDAWSSQYHRVRLHRISPHEAYVVRSLSRFEFRQYLDILKRHFAASKDPDASEVRMVQEELLVERCLLYPKVTAKDLCGKPDPETGKVHRIGLAGTVSILAIDIEEISNITDSMVAPFEEL